MNGRRWASAVAVLAVLLTTGCGDEDGEGRDGASGSDRIRPPASTPPGAPIADDLTVPDGTSLVAGTAFWHTTEELPGATPPDPPPEDPPPDGWTAYLTVEGDPFAAFDDLAAQLRERVGVAMGGTAESCLWQTPTGPAMEGGWVVPVTAAPPPADTSGVDCWTKASHEKDRRSIEYNLSLWWHEEEPPSLEIRRSTGYVAEAGNASSLVMIEDPTRLPDGQPRPDRVPAEASSHLPDVSSQSTASVGEKFGGSANCFETGESRFRLPPGARVVGDVLSRGSTSILAVDDVDATTADLGAQLEGDEKGAVTRVEERLQSGETVLSLGHSVDGGGGSCYILSSPDGAFVRISYRGD